MPWANGLGTTIELAREPRHGDFDWRVSVADITADGPFSTFTGCERVLTVVAGGALVLRHGDAAPVTVALRSTHRFDGDVPTHAGVASGAVRALNVITRNGRTRADVAVIGIDGGSLVLPPHRVRVAYVVNGTCRIRADARVLDCADGDALIVEPAATTVEVSAQRCDLVTVAIDRWRAPGQNP